MLHEESVIRSCRNDSAVESVLLIPTSETINDEKLKTLYHSLSYSRSNVEEIDCSLFVSSEPFGLNGNVDISPPDSLTQSFRENLHL